MGLTLYHLDMEIRYIELSLVASPTIRVNLEKC
jgi:hypothetical protein